MPGNLASAGIQNKWPPHCCVPAFVHAALLHYGVSVKVPETLPSILGVVVGPNDANPLALPISRSQIRGVTASEARQRINQLFIELGLPVRFRHVPLKHIDFGLYEDVLECALARELVVGVGVEYSRLAASERRSQHVLRVLRTTNHRVSLFDDSGETEPAHLTAHWDDLERAILAAPDGFWLVGLPEQLALQHTPVLNAGNFQ